MFMYVFILHSKLHFVLWHMCISPKILYVRAKLEFVCLKAILLGHFSNHHLLLTSNTAMSFHSTF